MVEMHNQERGKSSSISPRSCRDPPKSCRKRQSPTRPDDSWEKAWGKLGGGCGDYSWRNGKLPKWRKLVATKSGAKGGGNYSWRKPGGSLQSGANRLRSGAKWRELPAKWRELAAKCRRAAQSVGKVSGSHPHPQTPTEGLPSPSYNSPPDPPKGQPGQEQGGASRGGGGGGLNLNP